MLDTCKRKRSYSHLLLLMLAVRKLQGEQTVLAPLIQYRTAMRAPQKTLLLKLLQILANRFLRNLELLA
ncbi:hypothetical protein D3C71_2121780 [compost metagenome]